MNMNLIFCARRSPSTDESIQLADAICALISSLLSFGFQSSLPKFKELIPVLVRALDGRSDVQKEFMGGDGGSGDDRSSGMSRAGTGVGQLGIGAGHVLSGGGGGVVPPAQVSRKQTADDAALKESKCARERRPRRFSVFQSVNHPNAVTNRAIPSSVHKPINESIDHSIIRSFYE